MSNILKEPYSISVWEEELIPVQDWYVKGENKLTPEEYEKETNKEGYTLKTIYEHYEEVNGIIIGADDMDSPYAAANPVFKENVNGSKELTFTLYYKIFDPDYGDFVINPFTTMLANEKKIKLNYKGKWYDFLVKNRTEDSNNFTFTYTCKDLYINELNKNGFKVELDDELENNQGTVVELAETILADTDWEVYPTEPLEKDPEDTNIYSDALVETKIEPLYFGTLNQDIKVKLVSRYAPDDFYDTITGYEKTSTLNRGETVLFFYSDVADNKKHPQILCHFDENGKYCEPVSNTNGNYEYNKVYLTDTNEDIIINACNYEIVDDVYFVDSELEYNIPNITEEALSIYEYARGEKVIKSQKSRYDPDLDKFIFKFYKIDANGNPDTTTEYYGYTETEILSSDLAQNYLANSDNFTSLEGGWYFEGVPAKSTKVRGKEKIAAYSGQLFNRVNPNIAEDDSTTSENVLVLQLKPEGDLDYYADTQGEEYEVAPPEKDANGEITKEGIYVSVNSTEAQAYEDNVRAFFYAMRNNGQEGYADKTDDELEDMINDQLRSKRYSKRTRHAVNTGIAANRQVIKSLTPGEEYLFAVSLGTFEEGIDKEPEYGDEITYGTKAPTEYYDFSDAKDHNTFIKNATDKAVSQLDDNIQSHKYYMQEPAYKDTYEKVFSETKKQFESEYDKKYLWGINSIKGDAKDNLRSGGEYFRELFLNYIRTHGKDDEDTGTWEKTFTYNGQNLEICSCIAKRLWACYTNDSSLINWEAEENKIISGKGVAELLYDIFITGRVWQDGSDASSGRWYYSGIYPTLVLQIVNEAIAEQKKTLFFKSKWEPMGWNIGEFPQFDKLAGDIISVESSFNEKLFSAFYRGLREEYIIIDTESKEINWNKDVFDNWENKKDNDGYKLEPWQYGTLEVEELIKQLYKDAYEEGKFFKVYDQSKDYKEGGAIYLAYKERWERKAEEVAQKAAKSQIENIMNLFARPKDISNIVNITDINNPDEEQNASLIQIKNFVAYIQEQEAGFNAKFSYDQLNSENYQEQYKEQLHRWTRMFFNENQSLDYATDGEYYWVNFLPIFFKYWVEEQEIGTYVLADDIYDLSTSGKGESITINIYTQDNITEATNKVFTSKSFKTNSSEAKYAAVETDYNPYSKENNSEAGGYVFDRNEQVVRLFDPERDMLGATYYPVEDEDGAYIYDVYERAYRPFRDWSTTEKRNPANGESDEDIGVYGDVIKHPVKHFDGHLGTWEEEPTRYRMVRVRTNPEEGYNYLGASVEIIEDGYQYNYPVGYQTDTFVVAERGKYVALSDIKTRNNLFSIFKFGDGLLFNGKKQDGTKETTNNLTDTKQDSKGLLQRFFKVDWFNKDDEVQVALDSDKPTTGLLSSNAENLTDVYDEDRASFRLWKITADDGKTFVVGSPVMDRIENEAEIRNAEDRGLLKTAKSRAIVDNVEQVGNYTKYKWYYWRHWGKTRYNLKPKICILKNDNGVDIFKPFNNVEDVLSKDYKIYSISNIEHWSDEEKEKIVFYLKEPKKSFRQAVELDYGARKYRMDLQDKKRKEFWVESPNGEDYLRHYKTGDGEIELWDGHFGKWIDCFKEVEVDAEASFDTSQWVKDPNTGLVSATIDDVKITALPDFYLKYDDIMIPWDARVLNKEAKYTRVRLSEGTDDSYVLQDGVYITKSRYFSENGFTRPLDYSDLKVSLVKDFQYNSTNFSIEKLPDNREEFLSFDLSRVPFGQIDLVVTENTLENKVIKERWIYWKSAVKKELSLTKDPLQTFGMLFESSSVKEYPFLGMQLFKYIPYEKKEPIVTISTPENIIIETEKCTSNDEAIEYVYNKILFEGSYLTDKTSDKIITILGQNSQKDAMVAKVFQENGYLYDYNDGEPIIEKIEEETEVIPLFPGAAPDAEDLIRLLYYIYDPYKVTDTENVVYDYVGTDIANKYIPSYDEQCQKIRSIKGKEQNYFKLLQDCCDTFDCWVDPIIKHDDNGKVVYIEKPIYVQTNAADGEEPQVYMGTRAKEKALDQKISIYEKHFGLNSDESRITKTEIIDEKTKRITEIIYSPIKEIELTQDEKLELYELNYLANLNINLDVHYIKIPDKKIRFKRYVGKENWNGFKYGVNLKHIKRTIDSNQISTRVIVKTNKNEHAKDGFCTIQRAHENPTKENFVIDLSYYVQQGMLKNGDLIGDLYTGVNTKLNYYNRLGRLNKDNDAIIEKLSALQISLDKVTASYETAVLLRDAAAEEIAKTALTLTSSYDSYGEIISGGDWVFNQADEYEIRKQTVAAAATFQPTISIDDQDVTVTIDVPKTATAVEYPKYNDALRNILTQMDIYQREYLNSQKTIDKLGPEKARIESEIADLLWQEKVIVEKKNELNKLFYHKYSRYIQEGSWVDESYIDDNLYYLDALSVLRTSCKPKITYDIGVVDISDAIEYEEDKLVLETELGDRTYVEDTEFFGYKEDGVTPYWEMVVVSEKTYYLDDSSQNKTKVKNYSTQFDDLFKRIAATSQTLQFNEGSFNRAAALITADGTLDKDLLQKTIDSSDFIIQNSINEDVSWDNTGITVINTKNRANVLKIVSRGILISNDGGNNYKTAITGDGINADLLTAGRIDTRMLLIGDSENPNFFWNELGISAFKVNKGKMDYSSFVRLDQYGIYGIKDYNPDGLSKLTFNNSFNPRSVKEISDNPNAVFGLTWDGFFLNASNGTGRVTIGTNQDFKMSEFIPSQKSWQDKVIIGRLNSGEGLEYYGFQLKNDKNQVVMETNERGELYLKNKLRISNFNDQETYNQFYYVSDENGITLTTKEETIYRELCEQNNITLSDNEEITIYEYYYEYTTINGIYYKVYYSTDWIKFRVEEVTENWQNLISKPQDRVTLGIVDTYKYTANGLIKEDVSGKYSSLEYLTKVLSVKANGSVLYRQFSDKDINTLIDSNENLAIFDNGNLFARNAWIEGNIRATSGNILGTLWIGEVDENGNNLGSIRHINDSWIIGGDGTARFNNVVVNGTISSAVFEQGKTQTIAGSMLICPSAVVYDVEITENDHLKIYLESDFLPKEAVKNDSNNSVETIQNSDSFICYVAISKNGNWTSLTNKTTYKKVVDSNQEISKKAWIEIDEIDENIVKGSYLLFFSTAEASFEGNKVTGSKIALSLNTQNSSYPKNSFSIIDLYNQNQTKAIFGLIDINLIDASNDIASLYNNTYGLYCDNVYLKGSIISENQIDGTTRIAGLSTLGTITSEKGPIVFFAGGGLNENNLSFYVTESGYLYAKQGYFSGTVEASTLKACTILGSGDESQYALEIDGYHSNNNKGIIFWDKYDTDNADNILEKYLELNKTFSSFYNNDLGVLFTLCSDPKTKNNYVGFFKTPGNINLDSRDDFSLILEKEKEKEDVIFKFKGTPVAIINEEGIKNVNADSRSLGVAIIEDVKEENITVGIDIIIP